MSSSNRAKLSIAIDGYSSCGKSTFAKAIAARLGYIFIDTGAMYRAATLMAIREGLIESATNSVDEQGLKAAISSHTIAFEYNAERGASDTLLDGEVVEDQQLRSMDVASRVSDIAKIGAVREWLVALQQQMGIDGGVVMDGRDIGTVVLPNAQIKIFMTADPAVRAKRRYEELQTKGDMTPYEEVLQNIVSRDRDDETREISPLRRADDAEILDNSYMSVEQQMEWFDELYAAANQMEE